MIKVKDMPKDIFSASRLIIDQEFEKERLQERIRELEVRMMIENICPFCNFEPNKIIKEEGTETYSCEHCKSMMFENEFGGYETRKAHRIK